MGDAPTNDRNHLMKILATVRIGHTYAVCWQCREVGPVVTVYNDNDEILLTFCWSCLYTYGWHNRLTMPE